jgi:hypothetical protein
MSSLSDQGYLALATELQAKAGRNAMSLELADSLESAELRRGEAKSYRRVWLLFFSLFLVVGLLTRLLPRGWRPAGFGDRAERSVFEDARCVADQTAPFIFMT